MCHAVPAQVVEVLDADNARIEIGGVRRVVSTALVGTLAVGDFVVVHVGFALGRLDAAEAEATLALLAAEARA
ncbi:MAG: HypC/HybG/HupF family hydrogenase formation chaperone [Gammaproteobacteria bacterium HGW-Gammaproteobacteria-2]|jgi:hydrogenase expression/formation protein HypC|nr:MAG: HypC/HybG/HupF family hydrogenase formation chaperone [Gammaproteobacteria bacterium HGW-Gammaproteobacteria-2]